MPRLNEQPQIIYCYVSDDDESRVSRRPFMTSTKMSSEHNDTDAFRGTTLKNTTQKALSAPARKYLRSVESPQYITHRSIAYDLHLNYPSAIVLFHNTEAMNSYPFTPKAPKEGNTNQRRRLPGGHKYVFLGAKTVKELTDKHHSLSEPLFDSAAYRTTITPRTIKSDIIPLPSATVPLDGAFYYPQPPAPKPPPVKRNSVMRRIDPMRNLTTCASPDDIETVHLDDVIPTREHQARFNKGAKDDYPLGLEPGVPRSEFMKTPDFHIVGTTPSPNDFYETHNISSPYNASSDIESEMLPPSQLQRAKKIMDLNHLPQYFGLKKRAEQKAYMQHIKHPSYGDVDISQRPSHPSSSIRYPHGETRPSSGVTSSASEYMADNESEVAPSPSYLPKIDTTPYFLPHPPKQPRPPTGKRRTDQPSLSVYQDPSFDSSDSSIFPSINPTRPRMRVRPKAAHHSRRKSSVSSLPVAENNTAIVSQASTQKKKKKTKSSNKSFHIDTSMYRRQPEQFVTDEDILELDKYEHLLAEHAARVQKRRSDVAARLAFARHW